MLQKIFVPCACKKADEDGNSLESDIAAAQNINWDDDLEKETAYDTSKKRRCPGHEVCFSVEETINELDIPEENIATLLCYLELHDQQFVKALSKAYIKCKVYSYGGPKALKYVIEATILNILLLLAYSTIWKFVILQRCSNKMPTISNGHSPGHAKGYIT